MILQQIFYLCISIIFINSHWVDHLNLMKLNLIHFEFLQIFYAIFNFLNWLEKGYETIWSCLRMKSLNVLKRCIILLLSKEMMYKANFIVRVLTFTTFDLILPLLILLIYSNTNGFTGWTFNEILLGRHHWS